jgi:hypothetical protein
MTALHCAIALAKAKLGLSSFMQPHSYTDHDKDLRFKNSKQILILKAVYLVLSPVDIRILTK